MIAATALPAPRRNRRSPALVGASAPRIAPPLPARSDIAGFRQEATRLGIKLMPAQITAATYLTATNAKGRRLFREVAVLMSRQNGKTTLVKPLITRSLRAGLRIMHIAHDRNVPRHMFGHIADALSDEPELFPKRRGKVIWPRYGSGQEEIVLANGGSYRIAAARTGGARSWTNDIVIIDEVREMESWDIIAAAEPTLLTADDPLMVYLSNAGTDKSVVLNALRERAGQDSDLAYLEWSADPERGADDRAGWAEANPAIGHLPSVLPELERAYTRHRLGNTMGIFETEHLCRSAPSLLPLVVTATDWESARGAVPKPTRPAMGIRVDPAGRRASAVLAWRVGERVYVRSLAEDTTTPLDIDALAKALKPLVRKYGVRSIGFNPWTDRDLARHFKTAKPVNGADYQAAGERFERDVRTRRLVHADDGTIGNDLAYTVRRETTNGWIAAVANEERPTTAAEAAIRAVWLATAPGPSKSEIHF